MIIVVSGEVKNVGKTTLIGEMIKNLKGNGSVIKTSLKKSLKENLVIDDPEIIQAEGTDTNFFKECGAKKVVFVKSTYEALMANLYQAIELIGKTDHLIIEGNSVLDFLNPDFIIFITGSNREAKPSAYKARARADIIIESDKLFDALSKDEKVPFKFNLSRIPCYKAHLISKLLGIDLYDLGKMLDDSGIKLTNCQLGVF